MDTKLCRICGKLSENYVHIFKTEGLKNKIETCLPIIVSPLCLLPDTICSECLENVDNFYSFIKNCLQNIIVLEAQYDITDSCLKTKRKHEKGCTTDFTVVRYDKNIQTDDNCTELLLRKDNYSNTLRLNYLEVEKINVALLNAQNILNGKEPEYSISKQEPHNKFTLVNYEVDSDADSENECDRNIGRVVLMPKVFKNKFQRTQETARRSKIEYNRKYFDDTENDLISEIVQRKDLKRKSDTILTHKTKIFKMDTCSKRKSRQPKKVEYVNGPNLTFNSLETICNEMETSNVNLNQILEYTEEAAPQLENSLPQLCLLCDVQFSGPTTLAAHIYEMHGIDMAQVLSSEPVMERKKKIPNLVKITDLKMKSDVPEQSLEEPPVLQPTFVCPICPAILTSRPDLFAHLKLKHSKQASLLCGLCLYTANSYANLAAHLETCRTHYNITSRYICKICSYHDDNSKTMENHILVHDFIIASCKKQAKMFDPCDYLIINPNSENSGKSFTCTECNRNGFVTFKEFSEHRRNQHQIFHCDLCNKFYGRNSHLWKHVNRLHKGHPSITCQLCYKTSASKYHLAQHFNKIHTTKPLKQKQSEVANEEPSWHSTPNSAEHFMSQKFQGFDFQSVRQSFMRQEFAEQEKGKFLGASDATAAGDAVDIKREVKMEISSQDADCSDSETKNQASSVLLPKEIDASSDLYTNIITNYTPPQNEGEYKCPKCFKGFHKKTLLKKHKKNCRPRLQKDLLTRCKTCSRIFKDRQSLTKHLINYHSEYACEICGQKVQSKCEIVSHIRFSHSDCHLFCHCGQILRSKMDLVEHKKDHRNSFVCQFCGDMLPTKIKLKMHILSLHRKILSLSCGICLKLFETQHILKDHVQLVHKTELSPLTSCTVCGKNYGSKWKTYDHLNKSHGRIFKACKACLDVFDTESELQAHFKMMHTNAMQYKVQGTNGTKKDMYESDEQLQEENDTSSDLSNEDASRYNSKSRNNLSDDDDDDNDDEDEEEEVVMVEQKNVINNFPVISGQENRISLLEKRLLGGTKVSTAIDLDSNNVPGAVKVPYRNKGNNQVSTQQQKKSKPDIIPATQETVPQNHLPKKPKSNPDYKSSNNEQDSDQNCQQNPSQNSSKRTVYVNSNDPSLCEICLKTWPAKKHLWQHYIRCHKSVAATVCGICLKTNDNYKLLQVHLRENHPTLLHGQGFGSNFICRICGRYHNASSKLKLHMAIHENFDWSILERFNNSGTTSEGGVATEDKNSYLKEEKSKEITSNGFTAKNHTKNNENINYESLIEQIECSTDSENESDNQEEAVNSLSGGDGDEETDNESVISVSEEENSLESQMLQNMLEEKLTVEEKPHREYSSSESDGSSVSIQSLSDTDAEVQIKSSSEQEDEDDDKEERGERQGDLLQANEEQVNESFENMNIFNRKPEELDSAIRSISYEQVANVKEEINVDICDIQPQQTLNQHEIQSAVDSIL